MQIANVEPVGARPRWSRGFRAGVIAVALLGPSPGLAQQITVNPRYPSIHHKAPLAWKEDKTFFLMDMARLRRDPDGDWALQPMISLTWGRPVPPATTGWRKTLPDGSPLGKIQAFGGTGPNDGTVSVDWSDGFYLRLSPKAAAKYNLPEGTIFYSTRLNTSSYDIRDHSKPRSGYGTRYRIVAYMTKDDGRTWSTLPMVATSAKGPYDDKLYVGLWSSFLFERSDGTIQIYYDNELAPTRDPSNPHRDESWVTMQSLVPGPSLSWSGQANEVPAIDRRPGRPRARAGMASVSENPGDGTLVLTNEDVDFFRITGPGGRSEPRHHSVVRVLNSSDGGNTWRVVHTIKAPRGYNNFAPYHVRSRVTGDLILVYRSDEARMNDPATATYDPYTSLRKAAATDNPRWLKGNLHVVKSRDNGATWQPFEITPGHPYRPGEGEFANDPGVTELVISPESSVLVFQWDQLIGDAEDKGPPVPSKHWVQTLSVKK